MPSNNDPSSPLPGRPAGGQRLAAALLAGLVLGGCASTDAPVVERQTAQLQPRPQSVRDWHALAADVAARIAQGMGEATPGPAPVPVPAPEPATPAAEGEAQATPVVAPPPPAPRQMRWNVVAQRPSAFNRAFHALLVHELVQHRLALDSEPADGRIDYEVQLNRHAASPATEGERVEVLVTTTVRVGPRLLQTTADSYVIAQGDLPLYTPPPPAPAPAPLKQWKMVGE